MTDWETAFPALQGMTGPAERDFLRQGRWVQLAKGAIVFHPGDVCQHYLLVAQGSVRVQQVSPQGRELVLYRIGPGESCILTTACLFSERPYPAMGVADTDVSALAFPQTAFHEAIAASASFRAFVFHSYGHRLTDMLAVIEAIVFTRLDVRLARKLLSLSTDQALIPITHQALALELGSAREVISRALKDLEQRGWIRRQLAHIEILDKHALETLASDGG
ncbi:MAG: Crp/Fnr family transcriptional regulator [Betaproteobacteria bacterium]|nr:Crp/Fnr family transcriptional regulator [Betaproteobacteria bacterium]